MIYRKLAVTAALSVVVAGAHPGHEPFSEGTKHFISSPSHLVPALIFGLALFAVAQLLKRRRERIFLRGISITILALALV